MSYTIFTLGPLDGNDRVHTFLEASDLGVPNVEWQAADGIQYDVNDDALVDAYFRIRIHGDDAEDLDARIAAWRAQVPHPLNGVSENTFTYGLPGRTSVVTGTVLYSKVAVPSITHLYVAGDQAVLELHLTRRPHLTTPAQLIHDAAGFDLPDVASLVDIETEYETPLDILLDAGALELNCCYIGHYPDAEATIADFVLPLATATWSAGAATTDAAGYPDGVGNTIWQHTAAAYTDLDVTDYRPGEYLVLVRCKGTTANTDTIGHAYGPTTLIPTTSLAWLALGTVTLPATKVRGTATSTLRLTMTGGGGAEYASANAVCLLPLSFGGAIGWRKASGHAHALCLEDGMLYADDIADIANSVVGRRIRAVGGCLVAVADLVTSVPTVACQVTVTA
jgi:hypothetical protein